ncbi:transposase [Bradyrhizobium sp. BWC-3-1]|uniref:transposase n=1 Tax=Bradyrhizobium sp. BWC-3-1 TaxID=3080012 RepID=UPI00293EE1FB|nr:transposase [Bradyrhizobium sp. BWC-3-1]WOH57643.1 transposase [Bradyrhizobium sp. BWC-3-1]
MNARIAAESLEPGAIVTDDARRHGGRRQQVHDWRRRARLGQLVLPASANTLLFCGRRNRRYRRLRSPRDALGLRRQGSCQLGGFELRRLAPAGL